MKNHKSWGYSRYLPPFIEDGEIYICRIAPQEGGFTFDVQEPPEMRYLVYLRVKGEEKFTLAAEMTSARCTLAGLRDQTDYEFYVTAGIKRSRIRLVRTGASFGTVVNYLHSEDKSYDFSGRYLCSPSLLKLPGGGMLASMDLYGPAYPQNLTLLFRSDDDGATWQHVCELFPCFWGKLFWHRGAVYMFGVSTEYGDMLIGRSEDEGRTWSEPVVLMRGGGGKNGEAGMHRNPEPVVEYNGRLWNTVEWGSWGRGYHAPMVVSAPVEADLMDPDSWTFSDPVKYDPTWPGLPEGPSSGNIEGTLVVFPDGKLYNVMRYDMTKLTPNYGMALVYRVETEHPEAPLTFVRPMDFPANHSKFEIKYDGVTGTYVSIASRITDSAHAGARNLLSLMASRDMVTWYTVCDIYNQLDKDPAKTGFQYVEFDIVGDDLIFLCRTAWNEPHSFHDSNFITFDRIKNFRALL